MSNNNVYYGSEKDLPSEYKNNWRENRFVGDIQGYDNVRLFCAEEQLKQHEKEYLESINNSKSKFQKFLSYINQKFIY